MFVVARFLSIRHCKTRGSIEFLPIIVVVEEKEEGTWYPIA